MTWMHVALAVLVTIIVLVIAVSRSYALGRESGERDTLAGQGSDSGSLFGTDVPVREAEQGLIDVMPSEVIVCDGNGSVRCSSKSSVNVDVIENGWIVKDEILDILHVVVENGGVREREMRVSLDLTRMSSAISGRGVTAGSSAPSDSYLRVRVGHICDGLYAVFINDVTEQRRFEQMRRDFVTNVSHELKTPLTSIINYVDLMKKEKVDNETVQEYIAVLDRQSARLKKLIEDLMEASKASTGNIKVELEAMDATVMLTQVVGEFEERAKKNQLDIVVDSPEPPVKIMADGRHLWRVIDNLMSNICKYAMPGTRVYLTTEREGDTARMVVRNISRYPLNISADELTERFVRGDSSRSTEGSGLGLSIATSLMSLQGGDFRLTIDGDLFKVTLILPAAETEKPGEMILMD